MSPSYSPNLIILLPHRQWVLISKVSDGLNVDGAVCRSEFEDLFSNQLEHPVTTENLLNQSVYSVNSHRPYFFESSRDVTLLPTTNLSVYSSERIEQSWLTTPSTRITRFPVVVPCSKSILWIWVRSGTFHEATRSLLYIVEKRNNCNSTGINSKFLNFSQKMLSKRDFKRNSLI